MPDSDTTEANGMPIATTGTDHVAVSITPDVLEHQGVEKCVMNHADVKTFLKSTMRRTTIKGAKIWTKDAKLEPSLETPEGVPPPFVGRESHSRKSWVMATEASPDVIFEFKYAVRLYDGTIQNAGNTDGQVVTGADFAARRDAFLKNYANLRPPPKGTRFGKGQGARPPQGAGGNQANRRMQLFGNGVTGPPANQICTLRGATFNHGGRQPSPDKVMELVPNSSSTLSCYSVIYYHCGRHPFWGAWEDGTNKGLALRYGEPNTDLTISNLPFPSWPRGSDEFIARGGKRCTLRCHMDNLQSNMFTRQLHQGAPIDFILNVYPQDANKNSMKIRGPNLAEVILGNTERASEALSKLGVSLKIGYTGERKLEWKEHTDWRVFYEENVILMLGAKCDAKIQIPITPVDRAIHTALKEAIKGGFGIFLLPNIEIGARYIETNKKFSDGSILVDGSTSAGIWGRCQVSLAFVIDVRIFSLKYNIVTATLCELEANVVHENGAYFAKGKVTFVKMTTGLEVGFNTAVSTAPTVEPSRSTEVVLWKGIVFPFCHQIYP